MLQLGHRPQLLVAHRYVVEVGLHFQVHIHQAVQYSHRLGLQVEMAAQLVHIRHVHHIGTHLVEGEPL